MLHRFFYKYISLTFLSLSFLIGGKTIGQTLTVGGTNWNPSITKITEAGLDYANGGVQESATNQILLNVSVPLLLGTGKVSVHYEPNGNWPNNNLQLAIKRTGNGTTLCVLCGISGGSDYLPLTQSDQALFTISAVLALASYSNIPIQIKISGLSVTIPADTYSSNIVFTVGAP